MPNLQEEWAGVLAQLSPESLGELLKALGDSPAWGTYFQWLAEVRTGIRLELENCSDWAEYKEKRGMMRALGLVLGFSDEIRSEMKDREEEQEHR